MAFVVERMSMRHAPASLVAFCGKACAYAFFFCPGVADILVRLWNTPPNIFRRVLTQSNVDGSGSARAFTQDLALNFPAALRSLSFHSHTPLVRYLRRKPDVPLSTAQIRWQSPWVSRWSGRDSDLFFVFVKYIHILYADALPADVDKDKRVLAPGLLPIHAQLLVVLEDTLYKQSVPQAPTNSHTAAAITFDDFIEGADASVSALPLGAANSHRSMAENRLIILLRDFLSESSVEPNHARLLYAESFAMVMKTAAGKTSLFDHNACFLLCDFVEEVIPIITRYSQSVKSDLFDWKFWLEVCDRMMQSHNSLTEVRVFSFLFCVWSTWTASEERKADLCLGIFVSFDRVIPAAPPEQSAASISGSSAKPESTSSETQPPKKRWNLLKAMFGGSSSKSNGEASPSSSSEESLDTTGSDSAASADKRMDEISRSNNSSGELSRPKTAHQPYSFKFSLEWMDRPQWPSKNKRLFTPCLPVAAQLHLQLRRSADADDESDIDSDEEAESDSARDDPPSVKKTETSKNTNTGSESEKGSSTPAPEPAISHPLVANKYVGRALAEWAQIVSECDSFFARRRDEGVPCDRMVETPTLGVESFRK
ncbi:hypothetical protein APSETT444_003930 [Aspergillus pseudonomiae]